jgi:serine/threonine protein kinase
MPAVKAANVEPIPGYRLLEPLGKGGFGEVWKCVAPGGLCKAIKFVAGTSDHLLDDAAAEQAVAQEFRSLQFIKTIRHPFLLSIDRVEVVDGDLVVVMELADRNLQEVLDEYRSDHHAGIPRPELLGYMREAAEALDVMNLEYGLQHLDIKPRNLFLFARHVKVADFGLVNSLAELYGDTLGANQISAFTPLYASPESFTGKITLFSDQYSLAITYHELLTGTLPFNGKHFRQLALQHLQAEPDLRRLPSADQPIVARALAKDPRQRFASCTAFVQALDAGHAGERQTQVNLSNPTRTNLPAPAALPKTPTDHDIPGQLSPTDASLAGFEMAIPNGGWRVAGGGTNAANGPTTNHQPPTTNYPSPPGQVLPGYQFLECILRLPTGEIWRAQNQAGRKRLIKLLFDVPGAVESGDDNPLTRLRALRHRTLVETEILQPAPGRLAIVTDPGDKSLADHLKECQRQGWQGIPRDQLLDHLGEAAEALDALYQIHRLQHLGLTPKQLLLSNGQLRLTDFGLVELVWLPAGQQAGAQNTRYAAPELFDNQISRSCDQYSLALIFQELLTGIHAFRNLNARQMGSARLRGRPDLGMLPATDRPIILQALHADPDRRFRNCVELIEALEEAPVGRPRSVAPAAPRGIAPGKPPPLTPVEPEPVRLPVLNKVLRDLLQSAGGETQVREYGSQRYRLRPGQSLEHQCFAKLLPSTVKLKLDGFRQQWNANRLKSEDDRHVYQVRTPGNLWQRCLGQSPGLEVEIRLSWPRLSAQLTCIDIQVAPVSCNGDKAGQLLDELGRVLVESLRNYLQAHPERRASERLRFEQSVKVFPVLEDQELGEPVVTQARDLSLGGIGLLLPCQLPTQEVCVQLTPQISVSPPILIPSRIVYSGIGADGRLEAGVRFAVQDDVA